MVRRMAYWRRLAAVLTALAWLCAVAMPWAPSPARAEEADGAALSVEFSAEPSVMVAPEDVTLTFVIQNRSGHAVHNIYLASGDGLLSEPIGQLGPGESQTLVRPHTVTQDELDAGAIAYTVSHDPEVSGGDKVVYDLSAAIVKGEAQPGVSFTRQLSSNRVSPGGLVTVTYKIANTGNVALNALRIRDSLGDFTGRLEQLAVGESKSFISRVTLIEAAQSAPVLEYTVPSGESFSMALQAAAVDIADSALDIAFSVGQSVFEKDTADAILILTNAGNVDYTDITVLDDVYGGVIADAVSLPSGAGPLEIAHTYPLRGEGEYRWRITGLSSAGEALDLRTDTLTVAPEAGEDSVEIALSAAAREPRINRAGRVTFDFSIENTGTVMARDALLYEVNRGEIRRLAVLPAGEPSLCSFAYDVTEDTQFIFCLNYTDAQGRQRTVSSTPIDVAIAADGVAPEPREGSGIDLEGGSVKMGGSTTTFIVLLIIAGAALTVMITLLAVTSLRARRDRLRRVAAEKQRIKAEMGKTGRVPTVKAEMGKTGRVPTVKAPAPKKKKK